MSPVDYQAVDVAEVQSVEVFSGASLGLSQRFTISQLFKKQLLPYNWDGYGSPPPSHSLIDLATRIVSILALDDSTKSKVVPLEGGGVQVEFSNGNREFQISFFSDNSMEFLMLDHGRAVREGPLVMAQHLHELEEWLA